MSNSLVHCGVNAIGYRKNNINYVMACAWATHVDFDKVVLLLGEQSETGNNLKEGDVFGVSGLSLEQKDIAFKIGDNHSSKINKIDGVEVEYNQDAILIKEAKTKLVCRVIKVIHLERIEMDNLIYAEIISKTKDDNKKFLSMDEF